MSVLLQDLLTHVKKHGSLANHRHRNPETQCRDCLLLNRIEAELEAPKKEPSKVSTPKATPIVRITTPSHILKFWSREKRVRHAEELGHQIAAVLHGQTPDLTSEAVRALAKAEARRHRLDDHTLNLMGVVVEAAVSRFQQIGVNPDHVREEDSPT